MTTKTDEQERADFEAWAKEHHYSISADDDGNYTNFETIDAWEGYQARIAALQSQDREDALRYRYLRVQDNYDFEFAVVKNPHFDVFQSPQELDEAIDHARRIEGDGE